jgi:putative transposase
MAAVDQLSAIVGVKPACQALTVPRASWYRRRNRRLFPRPAAVLRCSPRALTEAEQQAVLSSLYADRFQDSSPAQVYAALLDEGQFRCSIRTMYRLLEARGGSGERRAQLTHPPYQKPELLATQANQLWSWDVTKLRGPAKWTGYHLYVILDVFSRFVVGWMIAYRECAEVAKRLIEHSCSKQLIAPGRVNHPCRSWLIDEIQTYGFANGRPRRHQNTFPTARFQRQSVLRESVPHVKIPPWLPRSLRLHRRRSWFLSDFLSLVQL